MVLFKAFWFFGLRGVEAEEKRPEDRANYGPDVPENAPNNEPARCPNEYFADEFLHFSNFVLTA